MTMRSRRVALYARLLTTTAGRFFEEVWLVNGNGTRMMSPNSKGIVDVVFRIAPDRGKARSTRRGCSADKRPLLLAQTDEVDKILNLGDALLGQRLDLPDQGFGIGRHGCPRAGSCI